MRAKLLSQHLPPCVFCGDIYPEVVSGPCQFTAPETKFVIPQKATDPCQFEYVSTTFQAQVTCGHCGATGTRYCGEEDIVEAEIKAAQDWAKAASPEPSARDFLSAVNKGVFAVALGAMIASPHTAYGIVLGLSLLLGVIFSILQGRDTHHRQVKQWEKLKEELRP